MPASTLCLCLALSTWSSLRLAPMLRTLAACIVITCCRFATKNTKQADNNNTCHAMRMPCVCQVVRDQRDLSFVFGIISCLLRALYCILLVVVIPCVFLALQSRHGWQHTCHNVNNNNNHNNYSKDHNAE